MDLKAFKKELLRDPGFKKEYYNRDDWIFRISLRVKKERIKKGLTQKQLAELIGTKQPSIARLENGDNACPRLDFLNKIAKALNINLTPPKLTDFSVSEETYEINWEELVKNEDQINQEQVDVKQFIFGTNKKLLNTHTRQPVLSS